MRARSLLAAVSALVMLSVPARSAADTVYLQATFDDKTLDAPIGIGGPDVGEPIYVDFSLLATVRGGPMSSPSLEIQDDSASDYGLVDFEFSSGAEITTGIVAISLHLWFYELGAGNDFSLRIREQETGSSQFLTLRFEPTGDIEYYDTDTHITWIGTYQTGRQLQVELVFDMDAGTYDLVFDGLMLLDDETHGVEDRGIGSILPVCENDPDIGSKFSIDDILVTDTDPSVVTPVTWGGVKALF